MTRKDFEYLCFNGVFEYEKLPKGRYYIPIDNMEEAITNHVKHKVQKWLKSIAKLHESKLEKWYTKVTRIRHFHMLRQLTQHLRQNVYFLNGIGRLRRGVRKDIDDNWSCGNCGCRLTRKRIIKTVDVIFAKIRMAAEVLKLPSIFRTFVKFVIQKKLYQSICSALSMKHTYSRNVYHTNVKMVKYYG